MVTENPTMAMAMASTYTRWKRLVSGLAGGSSLKGEADFNLGIVTTGKKHAARGEHCRGALSADEVINTWVPVWQKAGPSLTHKFFPGPNPRVPAFYLNGLSAEIKCRFI